MISHNFHLTSAFEHQIPIGNLDSCQSGSRYNYRIEIALVVVCEGDERFQNMINQQTNKGLLLDRVRVRVRATIQSVQCILLP